jgi:hypothetical protein
MLVTGLAFNEKSSSAARWGIDRAAGCLQAGGLQHSLRSILKPQLLSGPTD